MKVAADNQQRGARGCAGDVRNRVALAHLGFDHNSRAAQALSLTIYIRLSVCDGGVEQPAFADRAGSAANNGQ